MDGAIKKGVVLSVEGKTARVAPMNNIELVSPEIQIADFIGDRVLTKGTTVAYVLFDDATGLIFEKLE